MKISRTHTWSEQQNQKVVLRLLPDSPHSVHVTNCRWILQSNLPNYGRQGGRFSFQPPTWFDAQCFNLLSSFGLCDSYLLRKWVARCPWQTMAAFKPHASARPAPNDTLRTTWANLPKQMEKSRAVFFQGRRLLGNSFGLQLLKFLGTMPFLFHCMVIQSSVIQRAARIIQEEGAEDWARRGDEAVPCKMHPSSHG